MGNKISFVIPFFDEEKSLKLLYEKILQAVKNNCVEEYQIIFVNDGSTDNSKDVVKKIVETDSNVITLDLEQNKGKSKALQVGFSQVKFDIVAILDSDLQNNPEDIGVFLEQMHSGYDFVCGYRKNRKDSLEKKWRSSLFNLIFRLVTGIKLHDCNCGFKVFKKEIAEKLANVDLIHSYIVFQAYNLGYKNITEAEVSHCKRLYGKSKYGLQRYFTGFIDIVKILFRDKL